MASAVIAEDEALLRAALRDALAQAWPELQIVAECEDGVAVTVADDGAGLGANSGGGTGIGLKNVRERLRLAYDGAASLAVVANFPAGVAATLTVPTDAEAVRHG